MTVLLLISTPSTPPLDQISQSANFFKPPLPSPYHRILGFSLNKCELKFTCRMSKRDVNSEKKFVASDAKILGLSISGENTLKVEVAVLFPSVEGQVPEPVPRATLEQILQKSEESLGAAIGGTIIRIGNNTFNLNRASLEKGGQPVSFNNMKARHTIEFETYCRLMDD